MRYRCGAESVYDQLVQAQHNVRVHAKMCKDVMRKLLIAWNERCRSEDKIEIVECPVTVGAVVDECEIGTAIELPSLPARN